MLSEISLIDTERPEGKLLLAAIIKLSTESQTGKKPGQVLKELNVLVDVTESSIAAIEA